MSGFQFGPTNIQEVEAEPSKRIVGYFSLWQDEALDSIDYTNLTEIIYFHIWPNPDGSLTTWDISMLDLNKIRDRAHAMGVSVSISVGGAGASDGFPLMSQDPVARENFVSNITDFILTNNLDGVDINWETPINQAKIDNQDILLSDLVNTLHPLGKTVTVTVHGDIIDLKANDSIDWVNVMAYDLNDLNAEHSTFDDSVASLQMYEDLGIPKDKLVLGIPFYGRTDGWTSAMNYQDIVSSCKPLPSDNYCDNHFFNGIDLVQQKAQYVLYNDYDGVMVWDLGKDTHDHTSLLSAINEIQNSAPNIPTRPIKLQAYQISETSIFLTWDVVDHNEKITGYKIESKGNNGDWETIVSNTESNVTTFVHEGRDNSESYSYRISAINSHGTSSPSSTISESSFTPTALEVNVLSPTQIKLSWVPPSSTFGKLITGYEIQREITMGTYKTIETVGHEMTSFTINSLETDRTYTFVVKALFSEGSSPRSQSASATPNENFEGDPLRCIIPNSNYEFIWIECFFSKDSN